MAADPEISLRAQTPAEAAGPAFNSSDKGAALAALREPALSCIRCDLKLTRTHVVFGEGSPDARLIIFGEAPGADEDAAGRPFMGRAGKMINALLVEAGIERKDVWISNTVKCRPTKQDSGRVANRPPRVPEVRACSIWREGEMEILLPEVICCLGATAAKAILGRDVKMTQERGQWITGGPYGAVVMVTYHPAYILRQVGADYDRMRGEALSDLRAVAERLKGTADDA